MADECNSNVDTSESFLYGDSDKMEEKASESAVVTSITMTGKFKDGKLNSSNGICVKEDLYNDILGGFRELMKKVFEAEIFSAGSDMVEKVDAWVNWKTDGKIPKLMDFVLEDLRILLMNAISFEAKWEKQYKRSDVEEDSKFTNFDGTVSEGTMLSWLCFQRRRRHHLTKEHLNRLTFCLCSYGQGKLTSGILWCGK